MPAHACVARRAASCKLQAASHKLRRAVQAAEDEMAAAPAHKPAAAAAAATADETASPGPASGAFASAPAAAAPPCRQACCINQIGDPAAATAVAGLSLCTCAAVPVHMSMCVAMCAHVYST